MKKLKIILLFSIIFISVRTYIILNKNINSIYKGNTIVNGYITDYNIDGNHLSMVLHNREILKVDYYFNTLEEKNDFARNINLGDFYEINCDIKSPKSNSNNHLFNYKNYLYSQKIYSICSAIKIVKIKENKNIFYKIKNYVLKRINKSEASTYLKLFILGDKGELDDEILDSYSYNGVSHLFAVSGMHISLLSTLILYILNKISKNKFFNYFIVIFFLIFFAFLTSFSPSVLRATFLFILVYIKKKLNLNISVLKIIIFIFFLMILYNPFYLYNVGFLYSFSVSFSLILFSKIINSYKGYLKKLFITSLIAFLIGIPITISNFNFINFLSPILNLVFVPYVSIIIFPISLLTFFIPQIAVVLNSLISILEYLSILFSKIKIFTFILSYIDMKGIIFYYLVIIYVIEGLKKNHKRLFLLFLLILLHTNSAYYKKYPELTMIDVGQGDSILISLPYNKGNILIDTGGSMNYKEEKWKKSNKKYSLGVSTIVSYLKTQGIKKLDYLILTHGDADHMGEAISITSNIKVTKVIMNSGNNNFLEEQYITYLNKKNIVYENMSEGTISINNYKFLFLNDINKNNENEDSLIVYTILNNNHILLMGDAGIDSEENIIKKYDLANIDILKVGHHGSNTSSSILLLERIKPKYSLISVGVNNKYGHPHEETIMKLKTVGSQIFLTSIDGMVKFVLKQKPKIYTCYNGTLSL